MKPGNIILLHDWNGSEFSQTSHTVEALESIMRYLYRNDYECVTVSEMRYELTHFQVLPTISRVQDNH